MKKRTRASAVCVADRHLLAIELQDPATRETFWSVPGGEIEDGESPAQAAERETMEETGYQVSVREDSAWVNYYHFNWNARVYECETHWFLATVKAAPLAPVTDADYLLRTRWIHLDRLDEIFNYHPAILPALKRLTAGL